MEKTPSGKNEWILNLKPLPKIIENVKKIDPRIYLVGFKAEYNLSNEELVQRAYDRMIDAEMDLIVANDVAREKTGFGTDTNEVFIIDHNKSIQHIELVSKYNIATKILDTIKNNI
jgi:phosphopantothenoylcysteine decarboxylase/phosphopantothenate--cysteine ligase